MTRTVQRDLYAAFKAGALDLTQTGDHPMIRDFIGATILCAGLVGLFIIAGGLA